MATSVFFNNKKIKLPGIYSIMKSGIKNPPIASDSGTAMIIDTGSGAGWGGGSGVVGEYANGKHSVYEFTDQSDAMAFVGGGLLWKVVQKLFNPDSSNSGVSSLKIIRAATTTQSSLEITATSGGKIKFNTLNEGLVANGIEDDNDNLVKGYSVVLVDGDDDGTWAMQFWKGTWKGDYTDGYAYDEIEKEDTKPILITESDDFSTIDELYAWATEDGSFNDYFEVDSYTAGAVVQGDIDLLDGNNLFAGGTETYSTTALDSALEAISDVDFKFLLCDKYGVTDYSSTEVASIISFVNEKENKMMKYGGGEDETEFGQSTASSRAIAASFDNDKISVIHSNIELSSQALGLREWNVLVHTAIVLGREAGLAPQIPLTFKKIGIDGIKHELTYKEKGKALDWGICATYYDTDFQRFTCLQGINTLQNNKYLVNEDATTFSNQMKRIIIQMNDDIKYNAKIQILGSTSGVNRNSVSENFLKNWTKMFLETKVANEIQDNLILSFPQDKIKVTRSEDNYYVSYAVVPNNEITKIFFTGFLID